MATHFAFLLLLLAVPACQAVRCYECVGQTVDVDIPEALIGDRACINDPENTYVNPNCTGDLCVKISYKGKISGIEIRGAARGCDAGNNCADGEDTFSFPNQEYPSIIYYGHCSQGDLSNSGLLLRAPALSLFMMITSVAILLQCMMARQS